MADLTDALDEVSSDTLPGKDCTAHVPGKYMCRNGFPQTLACSPGRVRLYSPPLCTNEEWCARAFPDTGRPLADHELDTAIAARARGGE